MTFLSRWEREERACTPVAPTASSSGDHRAGVAQAGVGCPGPYRILMLARYFPPEYSGAAMQSLALARALRCRGHRVEFAVFGGRSGSDGDVDGFPVTRIRQGQSARHQEFVLWWNLSRFLARHRRDFDILHSHGAYYTQAVVGPLGRLFGLGSVAKATLSCNDLKRVGSVLACGLHRRMLRSIDACVAISADLEQEFAMVGVARERIVRIPNGVDTERFRPASGIERDVARRQLGLQPDRPLALYLGVFDQRKNVEWLARRWLATDGFGTGGLLLAAGPVSRDAADRDVWLRLRALADAHPAALQVRDFIPEVEVCYRAADTVVLPSLGEGLPNVVLEAMASGLPCAVSAVSGSRELVCSGVTGHTFVPGDDEGLARAVNACLGSAASGMGRAARERVVSQYGIGVIAAAYEEVYGRVLARALSASRQAAIREG